MSGKYTEELHRAPDDVLSIKEALREASVPRLKFRHTHLSVITHPSVIPVAKNRLHSWRTHRKGSMACQEHPRVGKQSDSVSTLRRVPLTVLSLSAICPTSWAVCKRRLGWLSKMSWRSKSTVRFFVRMFDMKLIFTQSGRRSDSHQQSDA